MTYPILEDKAYFVEAQPAALNRRYDGKDGPVEISVNYLNETSRGIVVSLRNGLKFYVAQPRKLGGSGQFIVRVCLKVQEMGRRDLDQILEDVVGKGQVTETLRRIKELHDEQTAIKNFGPATIVLDYGLSLEQLMKYGGRVYLADNDIAVSMTEDLDDAIPHPYSTTGRDYAMAKKAPVDLDRPNFAFCVEIVDNQGWLGDRFVNINNDIYRIRAKEDPTRKDGVYVLTSGQVNNAIGPTQPVDIRHYPLDRAKMKELGLYETQTEAMTLGDEAGARKRELMEKDHELSIIKRDGQIAKEKHDREMATITAERDRWQHEATIREGDLKTARERNEHLAALQRMERKDEFEERSMQRKDSSEWLKALPIIIVGLASIIATILGIMKPAKGVFSPKITL